MATFASGWFLAATFGAAGDGLDRAEFEALHAALVVDEAAAWETIPWRIDLSVARAEARESGRPLFLWSMNGHPLGCT